MRLKAGVLLAVLGLGIALAWAVSRGDSSDAPSGVAVVKSSAHSNEVGSRQTDRTLALGSVTIKRTAPTKFPAAGLFQATSWYTQPPLPKVTAVSIVSSPAKVTSALVAPPLRGVTATPVTPPPPPTVPSLPFSFIGCMIDGKEVVLFLYKNGRQYTAKPGDILDGNYRLDSISDNQAKLTYLPMNEQQVLAFNTKTLAARSVAPIMSGATAQPAPAGLPALPGPAALDHAAGVALPLPPQIPQIFTPAH